MLLLLRKTESSDLKNLNFKKFIHKLKKSNINDGDILIQYFLLIYFSLYYVKLNLSHLDVDGNNFFDYV